MWGRSVYSQEPSFVRHYSIARNQYNLTPARAAQFAQRVFEEEELPETSDSLLRSPDFSENGDSLEAAHGMKKANALDCPPIPPRGSRKSVNWAPQFNRLVKEEKPTITRSSSRLISLKHARTRTRNASSTEKTFKVKTPPIDDLSDDKVPIRIVSYRPSKFKKKKQPQSTKKQSQSTKKQPQSAKKQPQVTKRQPPAKPGARGKEPKKERKSPSESRSDVKLRKRAQPDVGEDSGRSKEGEGDEDDEMYKRQRKFWVSVPLNDMESREETREKCKAECAEGHQSCERLSDTESEDGRKDAIRNISDACASLLKKDGRDIGEGTMDVLLQVMVTGVKGVIDEVGSVVECLQEKKVRRPRAGSAAGEQKLRDQVAKLKKNNHKVMAENLRILRESEKLQHEYKCVLASARDSTKLQVDREKAQAALASLTGELTKEQEKSFCQICFTASRDAIVLPCMHFQYCNECLQKHQRRSTECPTCRGKINGVLRCNITNS